MNNESTFISHEHCEKCGSSDGRATYTDGHSYCFVCEAYENGETNNINQGSSQLHERQPVGSAFAEGDFQELPRRSITEDTCRRWGYKVGSFEGKVCHIANFKDDSGKTIAQKIRLPQKDFRSVGDISKAGLYGSHLWSRGKKLVITEGELDALSVSQINDHKWPVVSLPNGASAARKVLTSSLDYLENFEEVILMFDNDEAGKKAATDCASLLPVGKAKIASLPLKDANEMLVAGRAAEVVQSIFNARPYRPDGIVDGVDLWETVSKEIVCESLPYPWQSMNDLTHGIRKGEIATFCAGSGIGKSQLCKEVAYSLLSSGETIGYIALEENVRRTSLGLMGLHCNRPLHLDPTTVSDEEKRIAFEATVGSGRCYMYDHFGSLDSDNLLNRVRYMVTGCGCTTIFLDHLSIVVSGMEGGDERRLIDNTMTRLRSMVEELGFALILVSHLRRPEGRGHEDGAVTSLSQLRGSAAIAQLSDMVVGLERDQQDNESCHISTVRILKNRWSGQTGIATRLEYDTETGRMNEHLELEGEEL